jgi:hypothetical protein
VFKVPFIATLAATAGIAGCGSTSPAKAPPQSPAPRSHAGSPSPQERATLAVDAFITLNGQDSYHASYETAGHYLTSSLPATAAAALRHTPLNESGTATVEQPERIRASVEPLGGPSLRISLVGLKALIATGGGPFTAVSPKKAIFTFVYYFLQPARLAKAVTRLRDVGGRVLRRMRVEEFSGSMSAAQTNAYEREVGNRAAGVTFQRSTVRLWVSHLNASPLPAQASIALTFRSRLHLPDGPATIEVRDVSTWAYTHVTP